MEIISIELEDYYKLMFAYKRRMKEVFLEA